MNAAIEDTLIEIGKGTDGQDEPIRIKRQRLLRTRKLVAGMSGAGKSYYLRKYLEETLETTLTFVLDREADFATLREEHDIAIIGPTGELPTSVATAGALALRLVEMHVSAVIDLSGLTAVGEKQRFVRAFLQTIIDLPREQWTPMQIVIDEAQEFAPEGGASESRDAVIALMTLGRKRAICGILATPRLAMLSKDATAPCGNYVIGRFLLDNDVKRAAEDLGFGSGKGARELLRDLQDGEFYAHGLAFEHRGIRRFMTDEVRTTHEPGKMDVRPPEPSKRVKAIVNELAALQALDQQGEALILSSTISDSMASGELARTRLELERANAALQAKHESLVGAVQSADRRALERVRDRIVAIAGTGPLSSLLVHELVPELVHDAVPPGSQPDDRAVVEDPPRTALDAVVHRAQPSAAKPRHALKPPEGARPLTAEVRTLTAIAQHPGVTRKSLATLAGIKPDGTFRALLGRFKGDGRITESKTDGLRITETGSNWLGPWTPLPTGTALAEYWLNRVPRGYERGLLQRILDAGEHGVPRKELGSDGTFRAAIGRFKNMMIVEERGARNNTTIFASPALLARKTKGKRA